VALRETKPEKELTGEKATRIVAAMRTCVAEHGAVGATFDHVSKEAGVSRGLLHYYFGSKERLLIETIRSETDRLVEVIQTATNVATSAEQLVDLLLVQLKNILANEPELYLLAFETIGEARRHPEIGSEVAEYNRRTRGQFAEIIDQLTTKGVITPRHPPLATASALLAMANGLAVEMFQDPEGDHDACVAADVDAALHLLGAEQT
jgi:AcrR family transcriptional regulator